jgi:ribonuclease G
MVKEIVINSSAAQTRVAITEDGYLADFFVDYPENRRTVGDIYLGKVARVLPGIKAAFIDIGMKHDGFLHFSDIGESTKQLQDIIGDDSDVDEEDDDEVFKRGDNQNKTSSNAYTKPVIPKLLKGQKSCPNN